MASAAYKVWALLDFTKAARTLPSANPIIIGPSEGQARQVTAEF